MDLWILLRSDSFLLVCGCLPLVCFYFLTTSCCASAAGEAETRTTEKEQASEVAVASESSPTVITSAGPEAPKLDLAGDYISHSELPFVAL